MPAGIRRVEPLEAQHAPARAARNGAFNRGDAAFEGAHNTLGFGRASRSLRDQANELRREKKMEMNSMAENFHGIMRDRETAMSQIRDEIARLREETTRAVAERDAAARRAESMMTEARETVAREVANLKRQLDETAQRLAQTISERDNLQAQKDEMMRLPSIRPISVTPPSIGNQPPAE